MTRRGPKPKPGQKKRKPQMLADVNLDALKLTMAESIERVKAEDPKELRRQIADLKRQLTKQTPIADQKAIEQAVTERDKYWRSLLSERDTAITNVSTRMSEIAALCNLNGELKFTNPAAPSIQSVKPRVSKPVEKCDQVQDPIAVGPLAELTKAQRLILRAFYWLRNEQVTKAKLGFYSGYNTKGGYFDNMVGRLRSAGLVERWGITSAGEAMMSNAVPKPTGPELREWLRPKLGKAPNAMLDALIAANGDRLTKAELAEVTGYSNSGGYFDNCLGRLRSLDAAEGFDRDGGVKAADVFFGVCAT